MDSGDIADTEFDFEDQVISLCLSHKQTETCSLLMSIIFPSDFLPSFYRLAVGFCILLVMWLVISYIKPDFALSS